MKRMADLEDAGGKKRRLRRGRRKSKAERLARVVAPSSSSSPAVTGGGGGGASLEALAQLLADPSSSSSNEWDLAHNMALRLASPAARACVVRSLLWDKGAPKAAAHYARRLGLREPEALEVLARWRPPPDAAIAHGAALAAAKFLVEVGEDAVSAPERLRQFLWPWIERSRRRLPRPTAGEEAADPAVVAAKRERSELRAAVRLLLHPVPAAEHSEGGAASAKPAKAAADKRARSEALLRLLARECLDHGRFLDLAPASAAAGLAGVAPPLLERHACSPAGHPPVREPPTNSFEGRRRLATRVEGALRMIWPDCRIVVFGSTATGLLLPPCAPRELDEAPGGSGEPRAEDPDDLDLCVVLPSSPAVRRATAPLVVEAKEHLALYLPELRDVLAVEGARVPIAVGVDARSGVKCELSVNNVAAVWNTRLVAWLLTRGADARLQTSIRRFCRWLKLWRRAKKRTAGAALSSHGLLLLALYFLQQQGLLPAVDCSEAAAASEDALTLGSFSVEAVDRFFEELPSPPPERAQGPGGADVCWWTLVQRFFRFYAVEFDYERSVVSLRTTAVVSKAHKRWTRAAWKAVVSIEDPVEATRDLGGLFTRKTFGRLRCAIAHAACVFFFSAADASAADQEAALLADQPFEAQPRDGGRLGQRPGDAEKDGDAERDGDASDDDDDGGDDGGEALTA